MADRKRKLLLTSVFVCMAVFAAACGVRKQDGLRKTEASFVSSSGESVLLGGMQIGIYMETDGVMVLGTDKIEGTDGRMYAPAEHLVQAGDYIMRVNNLEVSGKKELLEAVGKSGGSSVILDVQREDETFSISLDPVEYTPGKYRLGIWVKDNAQGLGTVTFLTDKSRFGALGHGIHDADTGELLNISEGSVYRTSIRNIIRGIEGKPGSMEGIIVYNNYNILGKIDSNTEVGIYGEIDRIEELFEEQIPIETASKDEIVTGKAQLRCCIDGEIKDYEIRLTEIDKSGKEVNKGFVFQVTDPELLEKTGGIVQGMSGSPIIQGGKLIGAVTHVFVKDAASGYGIFIENMLNVCKSTEKSNTLSN